MTPQIEYVWKTQHCLKIKKPSWERQRRVRIKKCLGQLITAEVKSLLGRAAIIPLASFRHGYMNAVNEVSRIMAATPGMNVETGKSLMIHLGSEYNRLLQMQNSSKQHYHKDIVCDDLMSPAFSGYYSEECKDDPVTPAPAAAASLWRPW